MKRYVKIKRWVPKGMIKEPFEKGAVYEVVNFHEEGLVEILVPGRINHYILTDESSGGCIYLSHLKGGWAECSADGILVKAKTKPEPKIISVKDAVSKAIDTMVSLNTANNRGVCDFGAVMKDGSVTEQIAVPCHAAMACGESPIVFFSWNRKKRYTGTGPYDEEAAREFIYWITSKASPWWQVFEKQRLEKDKKTGINPSSFEFRFDQGYIFDNLDVPANALGNLCIATRFPSEYTDMCKDWFKFCIDYDCDPSIAYFVLGMFRPYHADGSYIFSPKDGSHWPLNYTSQNENVIVNFYKGIFENPNQNYSDSVNYRPCNILWSTTKPKGKGYTGTFEETYKDAFEPPKTTTGQFKGLIEGLITKENLVNVIKAETKRISEL